MTDERTDVLFPACCTTCPHLRSFTASCGHDLRQSLLRELAEDRTCPVYRATKTDAMRQLADAL